MRTVHLRGYALRDNDAADDDGPIPFVLATEGRKADGIDLAMKNVDLGRFQHNPVLGYGHQYWGRESLPIGRVDNSRADGDRLLGDLVFDRADDFAATVERKIRGRFINAVSVGFEAHDIGRDGVPARWELYETSVVPLPMDPDAVADDGRAVALARMFGGLPDLGSLGRAGKVLSAKNTSLVEDAITALTALLEAAKTAAAENADGGDGDDGDEDRAADGMAMRARRLQYALATSD